MDTPNHTISWSHEAENLLKILANSKDNDAQADAIFRDMFLQVLRTFELQRKLPEDETIFRGLKTDHIK